MLTGTRQSGGERSVSTMMYLISIQVGAPLIQWCLVCLDLCEDVLGSVQCQCEVPQLRQLYCTEQATQQGRAAVLVGAHVSHLSSA